MNAKIRKIFLGLGKGLVLLCAVLIAALPAVFMNSVYGYFPALLVLSLLLISVIGTFYLKRHLSVSAELQNLQCLRGAHVDLGLKLYNSSRLVCPQATASLFISDLFGGADVERNITFTIGGKSDVDFGLGMDMRHIGVYRVGLSHIRLSDFLGLVHVTVPVNGALTAVVEPVIRSMPELHITDEAFSESSTDTNVTVVGGTDYTGVREYVPGDPMKQIHWKLSAHSRDYLTKLQERSQQQEFAVILDFAAEKGLTREQLMDINDCLIETALSILSALAQQDSAVTLIYCNRERNIVQTSKVAQGNYMELIQDFCVIAPASEETFPDAAVIVQQEQQRQNHSANLIVVTSRVTEALQHELLSAKQQERGAALYVIVPAEYTSRDIERLHSQFHLLEESQLPYSIRSTQNN